MKEILLNTQYKTKNYKKYVALIDDEDFEKVSQYNWHIAKGKRTYYAVSGIVNNKKLLMHNLVTGYKMADHVDHNGLNNQKHNLRDATCQQNNRNALKRKNGTSKYKGVSWSKAAKKWAVTVTVNRKNLYLGLFICEHNAALTYNEAAKKYFGEFAYLNKIEK